MDAEDSSDKSPMLIKGTEGMLLDFAECCHPIPGDPIVGVLVHGKGIVIHVENCRHIAKLAHKTSECIPLQWSEELAGEFPVMIVIEVLNQRGILAVMALAVSDADANIDDISVADQDGRHYLVTFRLLVSDRQHLARVLRQLRQLKAVTRIVRRR